MIDGGQYFHLSRAALYERGRCRSRVTATGSETPAASGSSTTSQASEASSAPPTIDGPCAGGSSTPRRRRPSGALLSHRRLARSEPSGSRAATASTSRPAASPTRTRIPGPGIRYLLHGSIDDPQRGEDVVYGPGGAWFESGPEPVHARRRSTETTAFVRVLLLPAMGGKRTIRYVDPADEQRPKLQRPTVFFDHPLALR